MPKLPTSDLTISLSLPASIPRFRQTFCCITGAQSDGTYDGTEIGFWMILDAFRCRRCFQNQ
jgi:hypothetical protein